MKKLIIFPLIFFLIISCAVNQYCGLIEVINTANEDFNNIKLGDIYLSFYISKGSKIEYWYYENLQGKLSISLISNNKTYTSGDDLSIKLNYFNQFTIYQEDGDYHIKIESSGVGVDKSDWESLY